MNLFQLKWRALALAAFVLIFAFSGCKKDDDDPVAPGGNNNNTGGMSASVTLNGDGFNNKSLNFNAASAGYSNSEALTGVVFSGADSITVSLVFAGKTTGTYTVSVGSDNELENGFVIIKGSSKYYISKGGSIKVTEYGNVGGYIKGTFNGTAEDEYTNTTVSVSGSFSALRQPDGE